LNNYDRLTDDLEALQVVCDYIDLSTTLLNKGSSSSENSKIKLKAGGD